MPNTTQIALFGASTLGINFLKNTHLKKLFKIAFFLDNNPTKWGKSIDSIPIYKPTPELLLSVDFVLITSSFRNEIVQQILNLAPTASIVYGIDEFLPYARRTPEENAEIETRREKDVKHFVSHFYKKYNNTKPEAPQPIKNVPFIAFTICTKSYLGMGKALAKSYLANHPDSYFVIGLADTPDADTDAITQEDSRILVLPAENIGIPHFSAVAFQYTIIEFCTATKPFYFKYFFEKFPHLKGVVFLDPDIIVFNPLDSIFNLLQNHQSIVLTPHTTAPYPDDLLPNDKNLLMSGAYNLGFIGVNNSKESHHFLDWWKGHLQFECREALHAGLFVDQKWIDVVPSFFENVYILKDKGYNVAYWNLHERKLSYDTDSLSWSANKKPLFFFHFSGYEPAFPRSLSKHQNRHFLSKKIYDQLICSIYQKLLETEGFSNFKRKKYAYGQFDNSLSIPPILRKIFLEKQLYPTFENPFSTDDDSFYNWLQSPTENNPELNNLCLYLHETDEGLKNNFINLNRKSSKMLLEYIALSFPKYQIPEVFFERIFSKV